MFVYLFSAIFIKVISGRGRLIGRFFHTKIRKNCISSFFVSRTFFCFSKLFSNVVFYNICSSCKTLLKQLGWILNCTLYLNVKLTLASDWSVSWAGSEYAMFNLKFASKYFFLQHLLIWEYLMGTNPLLPSV